MLKAIENNENELTREKVLAIATKVAKERYNMSLERFIEAVRNSELDDVCDVMEVIGLLSLLPDYEHKLAVA